MKQLKEIYEFFTCRRYTQLSSKAIDSKLDPLEKFGFRLHHLICTFCRRSNRQFKLIEKASKKIMEEQEVPTKHSLSTEEKSKMKEALLK